MESGEPVLCMRPRPPGLDCSIPTRGGRKEKKIPRAIYGSFPSIELAEKACGALMDHGARAEDISLVSKENEDRRDFAAHSANVAERDPITANDMQASAVPGGIDCPPSPANDVITMAKMRAD